MAAVAAAAPNPELPDSPTVVRRKQQEESSRQPSLRRTVDSLLSTNSQAEYFEADQTIIILDWDDTLCPSSWIRVNRPVLSYNRPAPNLDSFQRPLRHLESRCAALLQSAMQLGQVVIVTNATEPWVEMSCKNFLPALWPIVSKLPIIYARSLHDDMQASNSIPEHRRSFTKASPGLYNAAGKNRHSAANLHSNSMQQAGMQVISQQDRSAPQRWKEAAFFKEISRFYSRYQHQSWKNIVSIGDSTFERDALRSIAPMRPSLGKKCRTKTVKLFDEPDILELAKQVVIIQDVLEMVVQHDGELDLEIDLEDLYSSDSSSTPPSETRLVL